MQSDYYSTDNAGTSVNTIWNTWTQSTSSGTITGCDTNDAAVWACWYNGIQANSTASSITADTTWFQWSDAYLYENEQEIFNQARMNAVPAREVPEEERLAIEARQEEARIEREAKAKEKEEAKEKALKLLMDNLNQRQIEAFERDECIPVDAPSGNKYRIKKGRQVNIEALDADGNVTHKLCAHPDVNCPDYDTMLAQKLMLERCEEQFLGIAIVH